MFNRKILNLLRELTISEFKLRDQGTVLGFFWTLLYPFLLFTVLYYLFTKWMGKFVDDFGFYLLIGIVQWRFFADGTSYALSIIVRRGDLVKNLNFPKIILVLSSIFTILISHILEWLVLLFFFLLFGKTFSLTIFYLPLVIFIELILIIGISLFLSLSFVYYRDIDRIWSILITIGFFLTPIFYSLSIISERKRVLLLLNPMTHIISSTRACVLYKTTPPLSNLFIIFLGSLILLIVGYDIFRRKESHFVELL